MSSPDAATRQTPTPEYLHELKRQTGLSTRQLAARLDIDAADMRRYLGGKYGVPYVVQFAIERLAAEG